MIEYVLSHLWQAWALICLLCLLLELTSGDFFILCFAIGAAVSLVTSLLGVPLLWQIVVFALASVLCLAFLRPALLRRIHSKRERVSNADAIIGRIGRVSEDIEENGFGRVALDGDDWKAATSDGRALPAGTRVKIVDRESIIITVEPVD
ncbi:MAG: NfeD family protein [Muribaculaceae bacterium]|nr:NfeD family protein [Muribaculaceae bacterium]